jgi:hypothetical protein
MKKYELFDNAPKGAPPLALAGAARPTKSYEMHASKGAAPASGGSCGCGGGGCGSAAKGAGAAAKGVGGAALGPVGAQLRRLLEEAGRTLQAAPGVDPSGGMNKTFQALQEVTVGLLDQIDAIDRKRR